jgi:hypothetical protein
VARPQTYTDSEIVRAIQALMAEGGTVNPMRVKRRLGGGNVSRIKALLAKTRPKPTAKKNGDLPIDLTRALERLVRETVVQARALPLGYGTIGSGGAGRKRGSAHAVKQRVAGLESELADSRQNIAQLEAQHAQDCETIATQTKARNSAAEATARLHAALRNAESDLRAAQRIIDTFERNQRQDREDIRRLQARNEDLVAELATLRARKRTT